VVRAVKAVVPAKKSVFGERVRRTCCDLLHEADFESLQLAARQQVERLCGQPLDAVAGCDKDGLLRIYSLLAHFCLRLLTHLKHSAENERLRSVTLEWLRGKGLPLVGDEALQALLLVALPTLTFQSASVLDEALMRSPALVSWGHEREPASPDLPSSLASPAKRRKFAPEGGGASAVGAAMQVGSDGGEAATQQAVGCGAVATSGQVAASRTACSGPEGAGACSGPEGAGGRATRADDDTESEDDVGGPTADTRADNVETGGVGAAAVSVANGAAESRAGAGEGVGKNVGACVGASVGASVGPARIQAADSRLVDKLIKVQLGVNVKAEVRVYCKQLVRAFGGNLLKSGPVSRSLTEDNVWAAIKALVPARKSVFGERVRRKQECGEILAKLDLKIEMAPLRRLVQDLSPHTVEMDKGGLRAFYALLAHFCQRLLRHVQCSADNDELKVATLHWLRRRALPLLADDAFRPLFALALGVAPAAPPGGGAPRAAGAGGRVGGARKGGGEGSDTEDDDDLVWSQGRCDEQGDGGGKGRGVGGPALLWKLVEKVSKSVELVHLKVEAKDKIKDVMRCFLQQFLALKLLNKSLLEKCFRKAVRQVVPAKLSVFGEFLRKECFNMPDALSDFGAKLQLAAMQREVLQLSGGQVQADKCGLTRLYSLAAHICLRLFTHVKVCSENDEVKRIEAGWLTDKCLRAVTDQALRGCLDLALLGVDSQGLPPPLSGLTLRARPSTGIGDQEAPGSRLGAEASALHLPQAPLAGGAGRLEGGGARSRGEEKEDGEAGGAVDEAGDEAKAAALDDQSDGEGAGEGREEGVAGKSGACARAREPHARLVDKIVKLQGAVPLQANAKTRLKSVLGGLLEGFVSQETLNSSVSAKALKRTVCAVIPPRMSTFGDRVRKGCCDMPQALADASNCKVEIAPMKRSSCPSSASSPTLLLSHPFALSLSLARARAHTHTH